MRLKSGDQVQEAGRTLQDKSRTEPPRSQIQCSFVPAIIGRMPAGRSETGETVKGASRSAASYEEVHGRGLQGVRGGQSAGAGRMGWACVGARLAPAWHEPPRNVDGARGSARLSLPLPFFAGPNRWTCTSVPRLPLRSEPLSPSGPAPPWLFRPRFRSCACLR
jgi:hypothetical protein